MNAPQFTPGPWAASVEKRPAPGRGYWYVVLDTEENGIGEFYGDDHETNAANLRIAAAAPDLYAAVEALLSANIVDATNEALEQANAALAKARGEQ